VAVECKRDKDCAPGTFCDLTDNICVCDDMLCNGLERNNSGFDFECRDNNRFCFAECLGDFTRPFNYDEPVCPENYVCVPGGNPARNLCFFEKIRCRTDAGLLIEDDLLCPVQMACPV